MGEGRQRGPVGLRTERVTVRTTPTLLQRLNVVGEFFGWSLSYTGHVCFLVGLSAIEKDLEGGLTGAQLDMFRDLLYGPPLTEADVIEAFRRIRDKGE